MSGVSKDIDVFSNGYIMKTFWEEPSETMETLWNELPWERRDDAPRREVWMNDFGQAYTYGQRTGQRTYQPQEWHPIIAAIKAELWGAFAMKFDGCFVNGYNDEKDALGWHSDNSPEIDDNRPIAVISLGAERKIFFRPVGTKGDASHVVSMPSGSLLVMNANTQKVWEHKIPKHDRPCGPRISLTFRGYLPGDIHHDH